MNHLQRVERNDLYKLQTPYSFFMPFECKKGTIYYAIPYLDQALLKIKGLMPKISLDVASYQCDIQQGNHSYIIQYHQETGYFNQREYINGKEVSSLTLLFIQQIPHIWVQRRGESAFDKLMTRTEYDSFIRDYLPNKFEVKSFYDSLKQLEVVKFKYPFAIDFSNDKGVDNITLSCGKYSYQVKISNNRIQSICCIHKDKVEIEFSYIEQEKIQPISSSPSKEKQIKGKPLAEERNLFENFYHIYIPSFEDANGDGIGDFLGIKNQLPYLKKLGITALLLSSIFPVSSYKDNAILSHKKINSTFEKSKKGPNYTFSQLLEDCHKEGLKVLLDIDITCTSKKHSFYHEHYGYYLKDSQLLLPQLNMDHLEVQSYIKQSLQYFIRLGVDGFCFAHADLVFTGPCQDKKNIVFFKSLIQEVKKKHPKVLFIADIFNRNSDKKIQYLQALFDSTLNYSSIDDTLHSFQGSYGNYFPEHVFLENVHSRMYQPSSFPLRLLSSLETGRIYTHKKYEDFYISSLEQYKIALALNILTPSSFLLFQGDEIGLQAQIDKPFKEEFIPTDSFAPMPFKFASNSSIYLNDHPIYKNLKATFLSKKNEKDSLYSFISKLFKIKNEIMESKEEGLYAVYTENRFLTCYKLEGNKRNYFIIANCTKHTQYEPLYDLKKYAYIETQGKIILKKHQLTLPSYTLAIFYEQRK